MRKKFQKNLLNEQNKCGEKYADQNLRAPQKFAYEWREIK